MADIGQSPFLQSLGWATLNSIWQWAALWSLFLCVQYLFKPSAQKKYVWALAFMAGGVVWYISTFISHYQNGTVEAAFSNHQSWAPTTLTWNVILTAASVTYLVLFIFPLYHFYKNWQYLQRVRHHGLQKASFEYRLFVSRVSALLGIQKKVQLFVSELVSSPITIGYIKPIILIPVAAMNNLSVKQTEAILLHELSHIKRYDYLINMVVTLISTLFYFNPFIKKFISVIEAERESCCDDLVLQFEYDPISYASALYLLEQNNTTMELLTIAAAQKKHLLTRIKKIVGIKEKKVFTFNHFAGLCASFLLVLVLNTLIIASKQNGKNKTVAYTPIDNGLYAFIQNEEGSKKVEPVVVPNRMENNIAFTLKRPVNRTPVQPSENWMFLPAEPMVNNTDIINVAQDDVEASVTEEQKEHINSTLSATKKVLSTLQWKEVEKSIADGMTAEEKAVAKDEYMQELEGLNWKNLESNLKASYNEINWEKVNTNLASALINIKLDSIQQSYSVLLNEMAKAENASTCNVQQPLPDASVNEVHKKKTEIQLRLDSLKTIRNKKVVRL
jgi:beta-lactamase regulating signal transducer with metallopeptidase domain